MSITTGGVQGTSVSPHASPSSPLFVLSPWLSTSEGSPLSVGCSEDEGSKVGRPLQDHPDVVQSEGMVALESVAGDEPVVGSAILAMLIDLANACSMFVFVERNCKEDATKQQLWSTIVVLQRSKKGWLKTTSCRKLLHHRTSLEGQEQSHGVARAKVFAKNAFP